MEIVGMRKTSEQDSFPWASKNVPLILIKGGSVRYAKDAAAKRALLATRGGEILACWPGQWSQDVFHVDDRKAALEALSR
ncbi:hypothetical protein [Streptosporangium subroseum]|uniref:hypothetical protein n=1 Tax=Streptosporangium subroseum TaxID=106412 RepID=UPI003091FAEF|nr:hypothetical protein OHB15_11265 [Streptosporangium subroseum]